MQLDHVVNSCPSEQMANVWYTGKRVERWTRYMLQWIVEVHICTFGDEVGQGLGSVSSATHRPGCSERNIDLLVRGMIPQEIAA